MDQLIKDSNNTDKNNKEMSNRTTSRNVLIKENMRKYIEETKKRMNKNHSVNGHGVEIGESKSVAEIQQVPSVEMSTDETKVQDGSKKSKIFLSSDDDKGSNIQNQKITNDMKPCANKFNLGLSQNLDSQQTHCTSNVDKIQRNLTSNCGIGTNYFNKKGEKQILNRQDGPFSRNYENQYSKIPLLEKPPPNFNETFRDSLNALATNNCCHNKDKIFQSKLKPNLNMNTDAVDHSQMSETFKSNHINRNNGSGYFGMSSGVVSPTLMEYKSAFRRYDNSTNTRRKSGNFFSPSASPIPLQFQMESPSSVPFQCRTESPPAEFFMKEDLKREVQALQGKLLAYQSEIDKLNKEKHFQTQAFEVVELLHDAYKKRSSFQRMVASDCPLQLSYNILVTNEGCKAPVLLTPDLLKSLVDNAMNVYQKILDDVQVNEVNMKCYVNTCQKMKFGLTLEKLESVLEVLSCFKENDFFTSQPKEDASYNDFIQYIKQGLAWKAKYLQCQQDVKSKIRKVSFLYTLYVKSLEHYLTSADAEGLPTAKAETSDTSGADEMLGKSVSMVSVQFGASAAMSDELTSYAEIPDNPPTSRKQGEFRSELFKDHCNPVKTLKKEIQKSSWRHRTDQLKEALDTEMKIATKASTAFGTALRACESEVRRRIALINQARDILLLFQKKLVKFDESHCPDSCLTLLDYVKRSNNYLPDNVKGTVVCDIIRNLSNLHKNGKVYQHLNPRNILVDDGFKLRDVDIVCGEPLPPWQFVAPECISRGDEERAEVTTGADLYSLGQIVCWLFCLTKTNQSLTEKLFASSQELPLLQHMLHCHPENRPTVQDLTKQEWFGFKVDSEEARTVANNKESALKSVSGIGEVLKESDAPTLLVTSDAIVETNAQSNLHQDESEESYSHLNDDVMSVLDAMYESDDEKDRQSLDLTASLNISKCESSFPSARGYTTDMVGSAERIRVLKKRLSEYSLDSQDIQKSKAIGTDFEEADVDEIFLILHDKNYNRV